MIFRSLHSAFSCGIVSLVKFVVMVPVVVESAILFVSKLVELEYWTL